MKTSFIYFIFCVMILSLDLTSYAATIPETFEMDPCNQLLTLSLDEQYHDPCVLQEQRTKNGDLFHKIFCDKPLYSDLENYLYKYSLRLCKRPLNLYLPRLQFKLDRHVIAATADQFSTFVIREWNPFPGHQDPGSLDLGSPFKDLKSLLVLDISFSKEAKFPSIGPHFFKGLHSLEALLVENLPRETLIAPEAFLLLNPYNRLQCLSILTATIPCSCDRKDGSHQLHHWLHSHHELWFSEGYSVVQYFDKSASKNDVHLCQVKLDCLVTEVISGGNETVTLMPFHRFLKKTNRCNVATPRVPTESQSYQKPDVELTGLAKEQVEVRGGHLDHPRAEAVRSSAQRAGQRDWPWWSLGTVISLYVSGSVIRLCQF